MLPAQFTLGSIPCDYIHNKRRYKRQERYWHQDGRKHLRLIHPSINTNVDKRADKSTEKANKTVAEEKSPAPGNAELMQ